MFVKDTREQNYHLFCSFKIPRLLQSQSTYWWIVHQCGETMSHPRFLSESSQISCDERNFSHFFSWSNRADELPGYEGSGTFWGWQSISQTHSYSVPWGKLDGSGVSAHGMHRLLVSPSWDTDLHKFLLPVSPSKNQTAWFQGSCALNWKMQPCLTEQVSQPPYCSRQFATYPCRQDHKGLSNILEPQYPEGLCTTSSDSSLWGQFLSFQKILTLFLWFFSLWILNGPCILNLWKPEWH